MLHITIVHSEWKAADTYFPEVDIDTWECVANDYHDADEMRTSTPTPSPAGSASNSSIFLYHYNHIQSTGRYNPAKSLSITKPNAEV